MSSTLLFLWSGCTVSSSSDHPGLSVTQWKENFSFQLVLAIGLGSWDYRRVLVTGPERPCALPTLLLKGRTEGTILEFQVLLTEEGGRVPKAGTDSKGRTGQFWSLPMCPPQLPLLWLLLLCCGLRVRTEKPAVTWPGSHTCGRGLVVPGGEAL